MVNLFRSVAGLIILVALPASLEAAHAEDPITRTMDAITERLSAQMDLEALQKLDLETVFSTLTASERAALATEYWVFQTDVPVVVSVMRHTEQTVTPFWLAEAGFEKTVLKVRNENYEYEVWQKVFPAGRVGLGTNGFEKHRPHYFVCVGAQRPGDALTVTPVYPKCQTLLEMKQGAFTYHDWNELVLAEVPDSLRGQILLPTIRGRARDTHLLGAFRTTPYPASAKPDQVTLTWAGDPAHSVSIQWRTAPETPIGRLRYRPVTTESGSGETPWSSAVVESTLIRDRYLVNDPVMRHFSARLDRLEPDTAYEYVVDSGPDTQATTLSQFRTGPAAAKPFTFLWMSDTHNNAANGVLLEQARTRHPDAVFLAISGDLVGTGQYRDDWDRLFFNFRDFFDERAVVPSIGNHDAIDGLGADMYLSLFDLPRNGPPLPGPEQSYSVRYGDLLLLSLDVTGPLEDQTAWIETELRDSDARWKVAMLHFPPWFPEEDYPDIRATWGRVWEAQGVDLVLSGHVHRYLRTVPMRGEAPAPDAERGTVYVVTVSVPERPAPALEPPYAAAVDYSGLPLYHVFHVDANRITGEAVGPEGRVVDQFVIEK